MSIHLAISKLLSLRLPASYSWSPARLSKAFFVVVLFFFFCSTTPGSDPARGWEPQAEFLPLPLSNHQDLSQVTIIMCTIPFLWHYSEQGAHTPSATTSPVWGLSSGTATPLLTSCFLSIQATTPFPSGKPVATQKMAEVGLWLAAQKPIKLLFSICLVLDGLLPKKRVLKFVHLSKLAGPISYFHFLQQVILMKHTEKRNPPQCQRQLLPAERGYQAHIHYSQPCLGFYLTMQIKQVHARNAPRGAVKPPPRIQGSFSHHSPKKQPMHTIIFSP